MAEHQGDRLVGLGESPGLDRARTRCALLRDVGRWAEEVSAARPRTT
ncbi:hypothetical protein [Streptomyces sp. NPDC056160]